MWKHFLLLFIGAALGVCLSLVIYTKPSNPVRQVRLGNFKLINPLLECDQTSISTELQPFKSKIENSVNDFLRTKQASHISVYFRDMNNGPWFGINEKEYFSPASLLKVPVMMTLFKQSESNPALLQKTVTASFTADANSKETIKPANPLIPGKEYTVDELVSRMIIQSDNNALDLINASMDLSALSETYKNIGVDFSVNSPEDINMSVKAYASFFRILFNASYLSPGMSEKALEILSDSNFTDGIRAGVPSDIPVAHKFGERRIPEPGLTQLHDCGIIYFPGHPYLLCVMTRGQSFSTLAPVIKELSSSIYKEVSRQYQSTHISNN